MMRLQFTLAQLVGLVIVGALVCATFVLLRPFGTEISLDYGVPATVMELAILGVILGIGSTRRFWIRFQVFGWLSFAIVFYTIPFWIVPISDFTEITCVDWATSDRSETLDWVCRWLQFCAPFAILVAAPVLGGLIG